MDQWELVQEALSKATRAADIQWLRSLGNDDPSARDFLPQVIREIDQREPLR